MIGDLARYGPVWYYEGGIANILSLYRVSSVLYVQYNSRTTNTFTVWKHDGNKRTFKPASNSLYYYDTSNTEETILAMADLDADQIQTIKNKMTKYNQRQLGRADGRGAEQGRDGGGGT